METKSLALLMKRVQQRQGNAAMLEQFGKLLAFNKGKGFCNLIAMPGRRLKAPSSFSPRISRRCWQLHN